MERVGSPRGIDGDPRIGHGPAIGQLLRALTATVALSMAGTLEAQEASSPRAADAPAARARENAKEWPDVRTMPETELPRHFEAVMRMLDDDLFSTREEGTARLENDVRGVLSRMNPLPSQIREYITQGNLEQRMRSASAVEHADMRAAPLESKLGIEGTFPAKDLLARWERHLGRSIPIDKRMAGSLDAPIAIDREDTYTTSIAKICRAIGAVPSASRGLEPAPAETIVTATKTLLGIITVADDGTRTMRIAPEPERTSIVRSSMNGRQWTDGVPSIAIGPSDIPPTSIHAGFAYAPANVTMPLDERTAIGFQKVDAYAFRRGKRSEVTVNVAKGDCTGLRSAPCGEDTRALFRDGRYELVDAANRTLPASIEMKPNMIQRHETTWDPETEQEIITKTEDILDPEGKLNVTLVTDTGMPKALRMRAWTGYREEFLPLPPWETDERRSVTPPTPPPTVDPAAK